MSEDDNFDVDERDDGENDEPEETVAAAPNRQPKKTTKNKKKNGLGYAASYDVASGPPSAEKETLPREADMLWAALLNGKLQREGKTPWDVRIQVLQMDPPLVQGDGFMVGPPINGGNVAGTDETPASLALVDYVINYYHLPRAAGRGSVKYQLRFIWAQTSANFARGDLILPGAGEIHQLRQAAASRGGTTPPPYAPPPMQAPPPPGFAAPPPSAYPSPPWPSYPPPSSSDTGPMWAMMQEMFRASMERRAPEITPAMMAAMSSPGVAAPPQSPPLTKADVASAVVETLATLGFIKPPGAADVKTVAQPPAQPPPPAPRDKMAAVFERVIDTAMTQFIGGVEKSIKQTITGIGAPPQEEEEPEEVVPPAPPDDGKPWKSIKVSDAKWSNGSQIVYTPSKESDEFFTKEGIQGFLMENPIFAEKGMELVQNLGQAAAEALKRVAAPSAAGVGGQPPRQIPPTYAQPQVQVVDTTPPGAADATPRPGWKEG
jgi:hypothetical protein